MLIQEGLCARRLMLGEPECGDRAHLATVNNVRMQSKSVKSEPAKELPRETDFLLDVGRKVLTFFGGIGQIDERERRHHQPKKLAKQLVLQLKQDIIDGRFLCL